MIESVLFTEGEVEGTIPQRFRRVAGSRPDHCALIASDATLTYAELDAGAERVASMLDQRALPFTGPVLVLLPESAQALIAIMGCLYAGRSFVVVPPSFPEARVSAIAADALTPCVLSTARYAQQAQSAARTAGCWLDIERCGDSGSLDVQPASLHPEDLAALFYTSGTTGEPKGVMWSHRLVLHTARQNRMLYGITPQDRCAVLTSFGFGAAMTMSFAALLNGVTLCLAEPGSMDIRALHLWLQHHAITVMGLPPVGLLRQFMDEISLDDGLPSLRLVLLGGQSLVRQDVERFFACFGDQVALGYRLAGSETMLIADLNLDRRTVYSGNDVPVGHVVPDKELLLWDEHRQIVAPDAAGEIVVRSRYLASGYWRRPELSASVFLADPENPEYRLYLTGDRGRVTPEGLLLHLGRIDNMVKVRGYRVQLEAVDSALKALDKVRDAVCVAQRLSSGESRLVAYLVTASEPTPTVSDMRTGLSRLLPGYMIPAVFVFLGQGLPMTATGKVDRQALPPTGKARPDLGTPFIAPRTDLERQIADIWAELLELDEVGVEDDFFALGGDSLLTLRMLLAIEKLVGQLSMATFVRQPTVASLAGRTDSTTASTAGEARQTEVESQHKTQVHRSLRSRVGFRLRRFMEVGPARPCQAFLPYGVGIFLQRALIGLPAVQRLFTRELDTLRRWQVELGAPEDEQARRISLVANTWSYWRRAIMMHPGAQARWMTVSGPGWIEFGRDWPRGAVILAVPHVGRLLLPLEQMIRSQGRETAHVVGERATGRRVDRAAREEHQTRVRATQTWEASQVLKRGGVVLIASDGRGGAQTVNVPFQGRHLPFRVGAATLAVEMDALFVPVFATFDADGCLHVDIQEPLTSHAATKEERIRELTMQYGLLYAAHWPRFYASMQWHVLSNNLELPVL